jgi:hypothetical protein
MPDTRADNYQKFGFPEEVPEFYTVLVLKEYSRPRPGTAAKTSAKTIIRLPIPQGITDSFNMDVSGEKMELLGNAPSEVMTAGATQMERYKAMADTGNFGVDQIKEIAGYAAALAPGISDTGIGKFSQSQFGVVRNPHLTTIFDGVKLKNYNFTWKMSAKSEREANRMQSMITLIKGLMHPKIIAGGFALEYPYLATLDFITGASKVNMPNVRDSFITRLDVNSAGSGAPAFFRDGNPVSVEFTLGFQEIDILTRDNFIATSGTSAAQAGLNSLRTSGPGER